MKTIIDAFHLEWSELRNQPLQPVRVAVVDSGIDACHPDLRDRVVEAWELVLRDEICAVSAPVPQNQDLFGHGTGVAGIVASVAPNAELIDIRVLDQKNEATGEMLLAGFERALDTGARVINLSLACSNRLAPALHALCERAYRSRQVVVAASRNLPLFDLGFPAELSYCISVNLGKYDSAFELGWKPPPIEVHAQGEHVMTTAAGGGYTAVTGTSFATPNVSGLCALLLGAFPDLQAYELKTLLKWCAQKTARRLENERKSGNPA